MLLYFSKNRLLYGQCSIEIDDKKCLVLTCEEKIEKRLNYHDKENWIISKAKCYFPPRLACFEEAEKLAKCLLAWADNNKNQIVAPVLKEDILRYGIYDLIYKENNCQELFDTKQQLDYGICDLMVNNENFLVLTCDEDQEMKNIHAPIASCCFAPNKEGAVEAADIANALLYWAITRS
jgi:hypothetical protein